MQLDADGFANPLLIRFGYALLHFLWQGIFIAGITSAGLRLLRYASPSRRYLFLLTMFGVLALLPLVTFWFVDSPNPELTQALPRTQTSTEMFDVLPEDLLSREFAPVPDVAANTFSGAAVPVDAQQSTLPGLANDNSQQVLGILVVVWAGGVCLLSLRLVFGWIMMMRVRRTGLSAIQTHIQAMCTSLCISMPVQKSVEVFESAIVHVPAVVGWLRPLILVPAKLVTGLSDEELRAILAHELAHIRRHDYLVNLGQIVVENLLFYHPVVWWLSSRIRQEREHCCDDIAAEVCGSRVTIARALATLAELDARTPTMLPAATGGSLIQRIRRLLQTDAKPEGMNCGGIGIGILCLVVPLIVASCVAVSASGFAEVDDSPGATVATTVDDDAEVPREEQEEKPISLEEPESEAGKEAVPIEVLCRIPDGRVLQRVPLPLPPEAKDAYSAAVDQANTVQNLVRNAFGLKETEVATDARFWQIGHKFDRTKLSLKTSYFNNNNGIDIVSLVFFLTRIRMCELEGDSRLWLNSTKSDFVVRYGATSDQIISDLERILNEELFFGATLRFEDVEREVYLAKGKFEAKPAGRLLQIPVKSHKYLLYGQKQAEQPEEGHGNCSEFWKAVGLRVGRRIVDESENAPHGYLRWQLSYDNPETTVWDTIPPKQFSANSEMVLKRISEQTGLTFEKATRTVRVLSLKPKIVGKVIRVRPGTDVILTSQNGSPARAVLQTEAAEVTHGTKTQRDSGVVVDGLQIQIHMEKRAWRADEVPEFKADALVIGEGELGFQDPPLGITLEYDGTRYRVHNAGALSIGGPPIRSSIYGLKGNLNGEQYRTTEGRPLVMTRGKHTIRLIFRAQPPENSAATPTDVYSNPVEIEVD